MSGQLEVGQDLAWWTGSKLFYRLDLDNHAVVNHHIEPEPRVQADPVIDNRQ